VKVDKTVVIYLIIVVLLALGIFRMLPKSTKLTTDWNLTNSGKTGEVVVDTLGKKTVTVNVAGVVRGGILRIIC
jgi:hypothetical protein